MSLGAPELLIILLIVAGPILGIVTAVSASSLPEGAFERVGTSRTLWIVLPLVGIAFCGLVSFIASIVWFASYRPRVQAASRELPAASAPPPPGFVPPPPPPATQPSGWHPDPLGRHESRYFDGTRWTEHVSDHGAPGTDPL